MHLGCVTMLLHPFKLNNRETLRKDRLTITVADPIQTLRKRAGPFDEIFYAGLGSAINVDAPLETATA